jgi:hypothetical protein
MCGDFGVPGVLTLKLVCPVTRPCHVKIEEKVLIVSMGTEVAEKVKNIKVPTDWEN